MQYETIRIKKTSDIPFPNPYVTALMEDYSKWAIDEERAPLNKGKWKKLVFEANKDVPLDLEIGTGNGLFFAHKCSTDNDRLLLGIELKYKPLIQTIRRALSTGATNMRAIRYHAARISDLFKQNEIDNVFIYYPDPWPKRRGKKNRLIRPEFLKDIYQIQKEDRFIEVKTDNRDYFDWIVESFKSSDYVIDRLSYDMRSSSWHHENYVTFFEKTLNDQGFPTHYLRAYTNSRK